MLVPNLVYKVIICKSLLLFWYQFEDRTVRFKFGNTATICHEIQGLFKREIEKDCM